MANTISLTENLNDQQVVDALNRQFQLYDKMERKLDGLAKASKKSTEDAANATTRAISGATKWAASLGLVQRGFDLIRESGQQVIEDAQRIGREYDAIFRKYSTLAGLKGLESNKAREDILNIAEKHAFTAQQATAGAQALVSAGFSNKEATGGSLSELLYGMAAAGEQQGDPGQFATAAAGYLFSTGKEKNAGNLKDVLQRVTALGSTNFQLSNLPNLAKEAGSLGALSSKEQFAAQATLQESFEGSQAATGLRSIVLSLTAKKRNKEAMDAMKNLGINPNEVDLQGENFGTAMSRIGSAYKSAPGATRDSDLAKLFGTEYLSAAQTLIKNQKKYEDNIKLQNDTSSYAENYANQTSGRNAAETRLNVKLERQSFANDQMDDLYLKQRRLQMTEAGYSAARISANELGYTAARAMGASQQTAGWLTGDGIGPTGVESTRGFDEVKAALDRVASATDANTAEMKRQASGTASPTRQLGGTP